MLLTIVEFIKIYMFNFIVIFMVVKHMWKGNEIY